MVFTNFDVGADDGYRLSLDGGSTWVINNWGDHSYTLPAIYSATLNGTYNMVLEYYENGGQNRISMNDFRRNNIANHYFTIRRRICFFT